VTTDNWKIAECWKCKPQGQVWKVHDNNGREGYFKFAFASQWYYSGPIVGNEWIAKQLADQLELPCAPVEPATIHYQDMDLHGIVSLPMTKKPQFDWRSAGDEIRLHSLKRLHRPRRLAATVAFDAWLANIDRGSGKNIILFEGDNGRCRWYLIDHAHALFGSPRKWRVHKPYDRYWEQIWRFYHLPRGLQRLASRPVLMDMSDRIRKIPGSFLHDLVADVPDRKYTDTMKKDICHMLLYRRERLPNMLDAWLRYKGRKESAY
jgi:hypothetical protein